MITIEQAKTLGYGDMIHHVTEKNADGTPARARVNGAVKFWKTRPTEFRIPWKHGLYTYGYVDHDNASDWNIGSGE